MAIYEFNIDKASEGRLIFEHEEVDVSSEHFQKRGKFSLV